jgi:hypothetical protein
VVQLTNVVPLPVEMHAGAVISRAGLHYGDLKTS